MSRLTAATVVSNLCFQDVGKKLRAKQSLQTIVRKSEIITDTDLDSIPSNSSGPHVFLAFMLRQSSTSAFECILIGRQIRVCRVVLYENFVHQSTRGFLKARDHHCQPLSVGNHRMVKLTDSSSVSEFVAHKFVP